MAPVLPFSYHYHTHVICIQIDIDRGSNKDALSIRRISNPSSSVQSTLKYQHLDIAERQSGRFCYITWLTAYSLDTLVTANAWEHTYTGSSGTLSNVMLRDRALCLPLLANLACATAVRPHTGLVPISSVQRGDVVRRW